MAANLETVVKQLADSGIIAPGKLENFIPPNADPGSVEELVAELVKSENLTAFQGQQVKAGKVKSLILGEYTILDKIGAGGMGQVFKAQHRRMKRLVAIKMLPPAVTKDAAAVARFQREVEAAAKLRHPNIVAADDAGYANGVHFLVMEFVDGKDLSALVKKNGPFPVNKAVNYILQAARGLEFAHSEGVVHRDIKPANLLLDKKEVVKILDMGLARIEQADGGVQSELTGTGTIMGTVDYMSPEQALNTRDADQRADIYSLGCSLYYLLAGRAAYSGETAMQKLMAHQNQPIPSLQDVQTTVPKQLDSIFKKMVAKKIEQRYQTMSEVVEALESLGYGGSGTLKQGEIASTIDLSSADRKKLIRAKKQPLGSITEVVASEKTKYLFAKIFGGAFGTIIAPLLVFYLIRHLEKEDKPAATAPAATVPLVATATSNPPSPLVGEGPGVRGPKPWDTPAFQAWMRTVATMSAGKQVEAVSKKLMDLNPGFDGRVTPKIEKGLVTEIEFLTDDVADISPVRPLTGLRILVCKGSSPGLGRLSDLSSLAGLRLTTLRCSSNPLVSDLSPLMAMQLTYLDCGGTNVADLSPLRDMPLTKLNFHHTKVSDLTPLEGCKSLTGLKVEATKVAPASVAALQRALPNCIVEWDGMEKLAAGGVQQAAGTKTWNTPAFQQWVKATQALPAEKQIEAVSKKLMELNPGFDGKVNGLYRNIKPVIVKGLVTEFGFFTDNVTDISPVRALSGLTALSCTGSVPGQGKFSDISLLKGMQLTTLHVYNTHISTLSPLCGMKLTYLNCSDSQVSDLLPLEEIALTQLHCRNTPVSDLLPLFSVRSLARLDVRGTKVTAASVSTLQQVLPKCQIEWDGAGQGLGARDEGSVRTWETPAFQQWVKATQALRAEEQIEAVSKKLTELNPGFDGKVTGYDGQGTPKIEGNVVTELGFVVDSVTDISPLWVLGGLKRLYCHGSGFGKSRLSDLTPLREMKLTYFNSRYTQVSDLSPLEGMPITYLGCGNTAVRDLAPLSGMPLATLWCDKTLVTDLSPLQGLPLHKLYCFDTEVSDLSPLKGMSLAEVGISPSKIAKGLDVIRQMKSVTDISIDGTAKNKLTAAEFWKKYDAGDFGKPGSKAESGKPKAEGLAYLDPAFQAWVKATQALPAEQQIEAVSKKLMELNPGFDGKATGARRSGTPSVENGVVTVLGVAAERLVDISPVRALTGLKVLECAGTYGTRGALLDLSPLSGMKLKNLSVTYTRVSDLSPLEGMPLTVLYCGSTEVVDLAALRGMELTLFTCGDTAISDLSPLEGMPLAELKVASTQVTTLSPLAKIATLRSLNVSHTKVTPAQVAALRKALPNCQIDWDGETKK